MQELTEEKKRELKAKYGTLFLLEVEDKQCILKTPDRKTLAMAQSIGKQNPLTQLAQKPLFKKYFLDFF